MVQKGLLAGWLGEWLQNLVATYTQWVTFK